MTPTVLVEEYFHVTPEEQQLIDFVQGDSFSYFIQKSTGHLKVFCHTLMNRNYKGTADEGVVNSPYFDSFKSMFMRFCQKNNLSVSKILRAAVNCTSYSSLKHGDVHVDHDKFKHYNFIMYLNDVGGSTYLYNEANKLAKEIKPSKNKVVVFNGCLHAQGYPKQDTHRFVLVFTFIVGEKDAT
jgi:hypothetical protein